MTNSVVFTPESVKNLLENGVDFHVLDDTGLTVILYAAHNDGNYPNMVLLNALLERDDIPREDKIDALEMAGAVIIGSRGYDEEEVALAFNFWRRALTLRLMDTKDCRPIWKTRLETKNGSLPEWTSLDDLLQIEMDPTEREMQSLLVQLRIFSCIGWRALEQHFWPSICNLISKGSSGTFPQLLEIIWVLCNIGLDSERPHEKDLVYTLCDAVSLFISSLQNLKNENPILNSEICTKLAEIVFLLVDPSYFTGASNTLREPLAAATASLSVSLCCQLFKVLSSHPQFISEEVRQHLVHLAGRAGSRTPDGLHLMLLSCIELDSDTLRTIRFLVQLGANLNSRNSFGVGALHLLAGMENGELRDATARLLLELETHLDMATDQGLTASDVWLYWNNQQRQHMPDWLEEGVPKLMCLSSRVIRRNKLPYEDDNVLPVVLVPYVALH